MEFRILGPLETSQDGRPISLGGARQRALLAILLLHANEVVSTDRLIAELWGERTPRTAASALRVHITQLRRRLGQTRLVTRPPGYVLELDHGELDAYRFEDLVRLGHRALGDASFDAAARAFDEALALWRGPALADLAYETFAGTEIARLEERRLEALEGRIEADLALGRETVAIPALETIVAEHPYREGPRGQLMLALYRAGRQAEALDLYRQTRRALVDELGVDPSPALQQLERRILLHDPSLELDQATAVLDGRRVEESTRLLTVLVALASGDEALAAAADTILRHDGRIGTFEPDRVVAAFGVPSAAEDDAERAVLAAVRLRDELADRGDRVAIGLSTGEIHVAAGSPPTGRVVSLAERLASSAAPGQALVSAATHRLVRLDFDFRAATIEPGPVAAEPVTAYEVVQPAAVPRKARGIEGLRAEIHGRDFELAELHGAVQAVLGGSGGQAVVVGGEPGVGKSRLVAELRERERTGSFRWLEGRCRASGASMSYLPYIELLTEHFGWVPEDDDRERERSIVGSVLELVRRGLLDSGQVDELVTMLANLLDVDLSSGASERLEQASPDQIRHRTFAALRDYLIALAGERPLALVLEDFHWADALSLDFTALLLESLASARLLVVCVSRPDPPHRWKRLTTLVDEAAGGRERRVELTVLAPEEARTLLYALLPLEGLPEQAEGLILDTAQGNPFFLEELLRELIDSGAIERENGAWAARAAIDALSVPQSVQAVVLSRVDRLDADARRIVEKAAVVGRSFPVRVLAALETSPETFERALWELESRDVVRRDRVVPEEEYSFHHVLAQEAVYRSIPRGRRADLHQSTAEAIERIHADDLEEHVEQLAYHYERSTELPKAVEYLWQAGEKSRRAYLNTEARAYFERGLALRDAAESPACGAGTGASLHEGLGDVLELTGHHSEAIEAFSAALAVAPAADRCGRARVHRKAALSFQVQRRVEEARGALDQAEAALGPLGEPLDVWWDEWVEIALERLYLDYFFTTSEQLEASMATYRASIETHASPRRRVDFYFLTNLLRLRKRFHTADDEIIALGREALAAAYESGSVDAIAAARHELGFYLLFAGRAAESIPESSEGLRLAERIGDLTLQCRCLAYLTDAHRMLGHVDRVRELASQTLERAEAGTMSEYVAAARASFAWIAVRECDLATAARQAAAALPTFGNDSPYRTLLWKVAWPLISVAFAEGRTADAATYAEQLLDPTRQAMPNDLRRALEAVVRSDGDDSLRGALDTATAVATRYGYA